MATSRTRVESPAPAVPATTVRRTAQVASEESVSRKLEVVDKANGKHGKDAKENGRTTSLGEESSIANLPVISGVVQLFGHPKFRAHRVFGLAFLMQYAVAVYMYIWDYAAYLQSPLVWSVPLNGLLQSLNAAVTFTFLPKTDVPGFAAVADKSILSYYTVVENSFYAMQLLWICCYLREDLRAKLRAFAIVEPYFVFLVFYLREVLWHSSRIGSALKTADKTTTEKNRRLMRISAFAIRCFYLTAKHFMGYFPNYLIFLGRVTINEQRLLYGVQVLSAYAATVSIFIHTLKFKGYIGPITALIAYDIIIPGFAYLYWNMGHVIVQNWDLAMLCAASLFLNLVPRWCGNRIPWKYTWHFYQFTVMMLFYFGHHVGCQLHTGPITNGQLLMSWEGICGHPVPADRSLYSDLLSVVGFHRIHFSQRLPKNITKGPSKLLVLLADHERYVCSHGERLLERLQEGRLPHGMAIWPDEAFAHAST